MAQQGTTTRKTASTPLPHYKGTPTTLNHPFQILSVKEDVVKLAAYSSLLEHMDIRRFIPIIGLDYEFQIKYGDKIYLEIIFDANGQVVSAQIRHDDVWWKSLIVRPKLDGQSDSLHVYPSEIELISKLDLLPKINELRAALQKANQERAAATTAINAQIQAQIITPEAGAKKIKKLSDDFEKLSKVTTKFLNVVNNFFGAPSLPVSAADKGKVSAIKKQFRAYKLIGNTTKNLSPQLPGIIIRPPIATKKDPFKLVQCLSQDLMLVDVCYNNVGCRVPIPWSKPIYYYDIDDTGKIEDEITTGVKDAV